MWVINCCVLTYIYIYIITNNNALHQHAENRLFLCHQYQGYIKPLNAKLLLKSQQLQVLDCCSIGAPILAILTSCSSMHHMQLNFSILKQHIKVNLKSQLQFFFYPQYLKSFNHRLYALLHAVCTINTMWASIYNNHAAVCKHGNLKYIYMYMYQKSRILEVSLCLELHLNCLIFLLHCKLLQIIKHFWHFLFR